MGSGTWFTYLLDAVPELHSISHYTQQRISFQPDYSSHMGGGEGQSHQCKGLVAVNVGSVMVQQQIGVCKGEVPFLPLFQTHCSIDW